MAMDLDPDVDMAVALPGTERWRPVSAAIGWDSGCGSVAGDWQMVSCRGGSAGDSREKGKAVVSAIRRCLSKAAAEVGATEEAGDDNAVSFIVQGKRNRQRGQDGGRVVPQKYL